jgi:hypothetical protein
MKISNALYFLLLLVFSLVLATNCKKRDSLPIVRTGNIIEIDTISAILTGSLVLSDGGAEVIARGVCWSETSLPTITDNITFDGTGTGSFTSHANGLTPSTAYYFRAYATNSEGTGYGESVILRTTAVTVLSLTAHLRDTGVNYVVIEVSIKSDGGTPVTARGICWSAISSPTIADNKTSDGTGVGRFITQISGLDPGRQYFFRGYATNAIKTWYTDVVFNVVFAPTVSTENVLPFTSTSAISMFDILNSGVSPVTSQGVCWSTSPKPTVSDNKTEEWNKISDTFRYQCTINGLTTNTTYYLRAFATNSAGTGYGNEYSFALEQNNGSAVSDIDGNLYSYSNHWHASLDGREP